MLRAVRGPSPRVRRDEGRWRLGLTCAVVLGLSHGWASFALAGPAQGADKASASTELEAALADDEDESPPPRAPDRPRRFDDGDPVVDPRKRELPKRHRFRLGLAASYIRLSAAIDGSTNEVVRFHHAPLMLDLAYQLQFAKRMMLRPGLAIGYNLANSRYAMPLAISPRAMVGYQGTALGLAVGYAYISTGHPALTLENGADGRPNSVGGPIIFHNHGVLGELSFTSRIDDVALYFALGMGATRTKLIHFSLDQSSWRFTMHFGAGVYFDGSRRRRKRAEAQR